MLMSEYGWPRSHVLWELPFVTGVKFINAIASRHSGRNLLDEKFQGRLMNQIAEFMHQFNQEHGLNGTGNIHRPDQA